jgi:hypothetical protein
VKGRSVGRGSCFYSEVQYRGFTLTGELRRASLKGLRIAGAPQRVCTLKDGRLGREEARPQRSKILIYIEKFQLLSIKMVAMRNSPAPQ